MIKISAKTLRLFRRRLTMKKTNLLKNITTTIVIEPVPITSSLSKSNSYLMRLTMTYLKPSFGLK